VSRPAEFLRSQLRLRIVVFAATVAVAGVLALMGAWWWPAILLALGLLFVLQRLAGAGRVLDPSTSEGGSSVRRRSRTPWPRCRPRT
jgi:hypothetical protein